MEWEGSVGGQRGDLALQANDAPAVGLGRARGGNDAVYVFGIGDGALDLLRAHGEADHRFQVPDPKLPGSGVHVPLPHCRGWW